MLVSVKKAAAAVGLVHNSALGRICYQADGMYGGSRSSRGVFDSRERGLTAAHSLGSVSRRQVNAIGTSFDERGSRGKAIFEEDRSGRDGRVLDYPPRSSRGSDHAEASGYGNADRRSSFRDEQGATRMMRSDDSIRGEAHRYGDVAVGRRVERIPYKSEYPDEPRWVRTGGKYGTLPNYDGISGVRSSGSDYVSSVRSGSQDILAGFIYEGSQRTISDWASMRTSFGLTVEDRRLNGHLVHGTKVFLFDVESRELYGVFQCIGDAVPATNLVGHSQVRVRSVKEGLPLLEREFRDIIRENYFSTTRFTIALHQEQVDKLINRFRPVGTSRSAHNLSSSRGSLQDFHGVPHDFTYEKEERKRSQAPETRSFSSQRYPGEDGARFSSRSPLPIRSERSPLPIRSERSPLPIRSERKDFKVEPAEHAHLSHDSPVPSARDNRGLSGSRTAAPDQLDTGKDSYLSDGDWGDEDERDAVYRKRSTVDEVRRGTYSSTTGWKDSHQSRAEGTGVEVYHRFGRGGVKDDSHYSASLRHGRNEIDLNNTPIDVGHERHGEPSSHIRDMDSRIVRRRVLQDDTKRYPSSPPKGRSMASRGSDYAAKAGARDEPEDMSLNSLEDHLRKHRQGQSKLSPVPASSGFPNEKPLRIVTRSRADPKSSTRDKPNHTNQVRRESVPAREVVLGSRDLPTGTSGDAVFRIKANLQVSSARGKTGRVVTLLNSGPPGPRIRHKADDDDDNQSWRETNVDISEGLGQRSVSRKRKLSVFTRLSIPPALPALPSMNRTPVPPVRGRVFGRLGPAMYSSEGGDSLLPDSVFAHKKPRMHPHQNLVWVRKDEGVHETEEAGTDLNPAEDDGHPDESMFENGTGNSELVPGEPQGWSRKKSRILSGSSGDESGKLEAAEPCKSGRRKIVRPPIEGKLDPNHRGVIVRPPIDDGVSGVKETPATPESDKEARSQENEPNVPTVVAQHNSPVQQGSPHEGSPAAMEIEMTSGVTEGRTNHPPELVSAGDGAEVQEIASSSVIEESRNSEAENMVS
ncbi:hypothetical protein R1sor_018741 [Riccia sorocarpa]|uniref:DCD domain-containing protein n=1 Tax=Riccia sorocarpa TaxID=122646 RepID=A0ABD3IC93_9MARC